jgi:hypothetical protein
MFGLMQVCYERVTRTDFLEDLAEKEWTILLEHPVDKVIHGFSTQQLLSVRDSGRLVRALFSGDTVIDPSAWGDIALPRTWGRFALTLIDRYGDAPLYWFLISKGYKTYRYLPLFFHEFYPRRDHDTPDFIERTIALLARNKFRQRFDEATGVVRSHGESARLRSGVADVTEHRERNPDIRFFVERNPGHVDGDELCCLAPLTRDNFTASAYRVMGCPQPART